MHGPQVTAERAAAHLSKSVTKEEEEAARQRWLQEQERQAQRRGGVRFLRKGENASTLSQHLAHALVMSPRALELAVIIQVRQVSRYCSSTF